MMTADEARLLATARVILRATAREHGLNGSRGGRIAYACEVADHAIFAALSFLDTHAHDSAARRFLFATDQELIDSL